MYEQMAWNAQGPWATRLHIRNAQQAKRGLLSIRQKHACSEAAVRHIFVVVHDRQDDASHRIIPGIWQEATPTQRHRLQVSKEAGSWTSNRQQGAALRHCASAAKMPLMKVVSDLAASGIDRFWGNA